MATLMTHVSSASLENLPSYIVEYICEYLAHLDPKRKTLFAFSLASKSCCDAATRQRFERIQFTLRSREKLHHDLEQWHNILKSGEGRFGYVRRIKVVGCIPLTVQNDADNERYNLSREGYFAPTDQAGMIEDEEEKEEEDKEEDEENESADKFNKPPRGPPPMEFDGAETCLTKEEKRRQDKAWLPLADFIKHLSGLKELIYGSSDQFPRCLLSVLHRYHSNSRLHIHTFSLRSLYQWKEGLHDIDPDEFALATSPCLYSIFVQYCDYYTDGRVCYTQEAVLQMVATLAPRLRRVWMWEYNPGDSIALRDAYLSPRPMWQSFFKVNQGKSRHGRPLGCLRSLALSGNSVISDELVAWSHHTDFAELSSLQMQGSICLEFLQKLIQMVGESRFKSLRKLALSVFPGNYQEQMYMDEAISLLLQNLPPLKDLRLSGYIAHRTFNVILDRHGKTLQHIQLISGG